MSSETNIVQGGASITIGSDLGYIRDGVSLGITSDMYYGTAEGVNTNLTARRPSVVYEIKTTLLEPTMANLVIAFDWSNASATASAANTLEFGGENFSPTENEVVIYGYVPGGSDYTRTITIDRGVAVPSEGMAFADAEETKVPLVISCLYSTTNSRVGQMSDATA